MEPAFSCAHISPREVHEKAMRGDALTLVDVRTRPEYAAHHIPGVLLMPLDEFAGRVGELDPNDDIICLCEHDVRSEAVARYLAGLGFPRVATMTGGMAAYPGPVETGP